MAIARWVEDSEATGGWVDIMAIAKKGRVGLLLERWEEGEAKSVAKGARRSGLLPEE